VVPVVPVVPVVLVVPVVPVVPVVGGSGSGSALIKFDSNLTINHLLTLIYGGLKH
jgi:hypothetical protein